MVKVRQSAIIEAPIEQVWDILRDFNSHDRWHPAVAASHIEGADPATRVGAVRNFRLQDGSRLREQLLSLSDSNHSFSYCLLEAPIPLMNYVAQLKLMPVTDGNATFWEWKSTFDPPEHRRDELVRLVTRDIYQAGFAAIQRMFGGNGGSAGAHPASGGSAFPWALRAQSIQSPAPSPGPVQARPTPPRETAPLQVVRPTAQTSSQPQTGSAVTRAIVVDRYGAPDVMQMRDVALAPLRPDEVRVRHTVVGVNYIDIYCRTGFFTMLTPPGTPGMEAAGVIEEVGRDVAGLEAGDRVAYACPPVGSYCERRNMSPELLVRLPDDVSDETAAAGLLKGVSASFLLHDIGRVTAGDVVLIHAAAGGVGQLLVQWARHIGATVIATVSSDEKARLAGALGAHHVINYSRSNFTDAVMHVTGGRGANVIYDAVGQDTLAGSIAALAVRGHLVSFGQASGPIGAWDLDKFASKSITFSRPNYGHYSDTPEKLGVHVGHFFRTLRQRV